MTKSELKTGMIVITREGVKCMVYTNIQTACTTRKPNYGDAVIVALDGSHYWNVLSDYNENMETKNRDLGKYDIMEVIQVDHPFCFTDHKYEVTGQKTLWKRPEKKKYTYGQLREILGEEFEVVGW
jgi:uncharacterized protein YjbK